MPPVSSRYSQALALLQSRITVATEMPGASAASSTLSPPATNAHGYRSAQGHPPRLAADMDGRFQAVLTSVFYARVGRS